MPTLILESDHGLSSLFCTKDTRLCHKEKQFQGDRCSKQKFQKQFVYSWAEKLSGVDLGM